MSGIRPAPPGRGDALKAVAHVHSEWSDDASWPLSRIAATFARRGYRVVLMSEHSRGFTAAKWDDYRQACADASTDRVRLVPGIEYGDEDNVVHIPVWGQVPFFGDAPQIGSLLKQATEAGGTAVWAHPWRRAAWQRCEPSWWEHLGAVEVWNRKYDGIAPNRDSLALARQHDAAQFVALDLHTRHQLFPLSLRLTVPGLPESGLPGSGLPGSGLPGSGLPGSGLAGAGRAEPGHPAARAVPDCDQVYRALHEGDFAAQAFGIALGQLTAGPAAQVLRLLEGTRRAAARVLH
jgi:hypothetical protein